MKEKIIEIMRNELDSAYCNNCRHYNRDTDYDMCSFCHRKYMNWQPSDECLNGMADDIIAWVKTVSDAIPIDYLREIQGLCYQVADAKERGDIIGSIIEAWELDKEE